MMEIVFKILLSLYAVFTLLAVISDARANKFNPAHLFFLMGCVILIAVVFFNIPYPLALLIAGLACMHIAAVIAGKTAGFHLSHHIVRAVISLAFVLTFLQINM